jgi:hypothetical protein
VFAHGTQEPDLKWKSLPENVGFVVEAVIHGVEIY